MAAVKDMTTGRPMRLIVWFALPMILSNVFQQLYTMIDSVIVGRGVGVKALAAIGAGDWINWMLLGLVLGFTQGFSIRFSQRFGAGDAEGLRRAVGQSIVLSALIAVGMTVVSIGITRPILLLLQTPDDVIGMSQTYLWTLFAGIPIITAFNLAAALLRSLGNSRTPLLAMVLATLINIGLDLLFVMVFQWGVFGAALATVLAQGCSFVFCMLALRRISILRLQRSDFSLHLHECTALLRLGLPVAVQNAIICVGGMAVQYVVNQYGFVFMAGFTATNKLYGILEMSAVSLGGSIQTYAGQNFGAGQYHRIRQGVRATVLLGIAISVVVGGSMLVFGHSMIGWFVEEGMADTPAVIEVAYRYLFIMCVFLWILYLLHVYRAALQGLGDTLVPMLSGGAELLMRVAVALLLPLWVGQDGIFYAEVIAWAGADCVLLPVYFSRIRKMPKDDAPRAPEEV